LLIGAPQSGRCFRRGQFREVSSLLVPVTVTMPTLSALILALCVRPGRLDPPLLRRFIGELRWSPVRDQLVPLSEG
jgi:hypothetical protein